MSLAIVAAKDLEHANKLLEKRASKHHWVIEERWIREFLCDTTHLVYSEYYKFSLYGVTYAEKDDVYKIKIFADSMLEFIENIDENDMVMKYKISKKRVCKFIIGLIEVCILAKENEYILVGIGD